MGGPPPPVAGSPPPGSLKIWPSENFVGKNTFVKTLTTWRLIVSGNYCVYKHTSPEGKVYIGMTSGNPEKRWKGGFGYVDNLPLFVDIVAKGWDNFRHDILISGLSEEEARVKEAEMIALYQGCDYRFGYNRIGAAGSSDATTIPPGPHYDRRCRVPVLCVETHREYPSLNAAAKAIGVHRATLRNTILNGWSCRGYHWEFVTNEQEEHSA